MKLKDDTIRGVDVSIHVGGDGTFRIECISPDGRGDTLSTGTTLEQARTKAASELGKRKVKVAVPFIDAKSLQRGVATGIHGGTRSFMVRWDDGSTTQHDGYHSIGTDIPDEELQRLKELDRTRMSADREIRLIKDQWNFNLRAAVNSAIAEGSRDDD